MIYFDNCSQKNTKPQTSRYGGFHRSASFWYGRKEEGNKEVFNYLQFAPRDGIGCIWFRAGRLRAMQDLWVDAGGEGRPGWGSLLHVIIILGLCYASVGRFSFRGQYAVVCRWGFLVRVCLRWVRRRWAVWGCPTIPWVKSFRLKNPTFIPYGITITKKCIHLLVASS